MHLLIENDTIVSDRARVYIDGELATDVSKVVLTLEVGQVALVEITRAVRSLAVDVNVEAV